MVMLTGRLHSPKADAAGVVGTVGRCIIIRVRPAKRCQGKSSAIGISAPRSGTHPTSAYTLSSGHIFPIGRNYGGSLNIYRVLMLEKAPED